MFDISLRCDLRGADRCTRSHGVVICSAVESRSVDAGAFFIAYKKCEGNDCHIVCLQIGAVKVCRGVGYNAKHSHKGSNI